MRGRGGGPKSIFSLEFDEAKMKEKFGDFDPSKFEDEAGNGDNNKDKESQWDFKKIADSESTWEFEKDNFGDRMGDSFGRGRGGMDRGRGRGFYGGVGQFDREREGFEGCSGYFQEN